MELKKINKFKSKIKSKIFKCGVCGLKYPNKNLAQKCEAWCKKHNSCNLKIIKHSILNNGRKK